MGFSLVVEALIKAQKPIIGHNMIYDIIYLYNQFIGPLPANYADFTNEWIACFPSLYDTKVLAT
jgi:poly(A)-specific ribonuclease